MNYSTRMVALGDIATELSDGLHKAPVFYPGAEYIFVNATNLENGRIVDKEPAKHTNHEEYKKYGVPLSDRTILYSIDGTIGNIARYRGEKVVLGKGACYINVDQSCDVDYIYYQLQSPHFTDYIRSMATGSTIRHISLRTMRNYVFSLPPISLQKRVASILSSIDRRIENNSQINDNLQQQAIAIYESMFTPHTDNDGALGALKDIAEITMGQSPSGSSYNENGIGEVFYQGRAEFGTRFPNRRLYTTEPKRMAEAGDILLSVRAPVGDLNVAYERCCIGRGLGAIHSKSGHSSFILYTMISLQPQLDVFNGEGTVFGSINRNALNDLPIQLPAQAAIDEFERMVHPMDDLIRTNYEENCRLQALRDSLLPRLMSGEIDVSDFTL